jgi:hypothetical protein
MTPDDAMAVLKAHLRSVHNSELYALDEDGNPVHPKGDYVIDPSPAGDIAREWARELLNEADANGLYGCRLCRS